MRLTEEEQKCLQCLAEGITFEEMTAELGWTLEGVENFGTEF
jgi:hypothetical protein